MKAQVRSAVGLAFGFALATASMVAAERRAEAADPWVERRLTLPRHDWAFDFGMGIGHYDYGTPGARQINGTGVGLNLEGAVAIIHHLELGFREGLRVGDDGRLARADTYGRLYDRQNWGTLQDNVANPELRIRGQLVDLEIIELALEGRVWLPIERPNSAMRFGTMFGVPLAFHIGHVVRLDTGVYVPILLNDNDTVSAISFPIDAWFQVTDRMWLGPMSGFFITNPGGHAHVPLGFGMGYQVASFVDLKWQLLFPAIDDNRGSANFGVGFGAQIRIE